MIDKQQLLAKIIARLEKEVEVLKRGANIAREEATNPESKAENKYDTRGLEAAYLAAGQSDRIAKAQKDLEEYKALKMQLYTEDSPIGIGAYIELEAEGSGRSCYFLGMQGGGVEVDFDSKRVLLITPSSPLGQSLLGKRVGDIIISYTARGMREYEVMEVA